MDWVSNHLPGKKIGGKMKDRNVEKYFVLVFLILTPLISIAIALFSPLPPELIALTMACVPAILAILLTGITGGGNGIAALLQKLLQWRTGFKWYVLAVMIPLAIHLTMSLLALWFGWIASIQVKPWSLAQFIFVGVFMMIAAPLEELGWRGYALPRLLIFRSALACALIIGVFWGVLHLPLSAPGMVNAGVPWTTAMLNFIGFSVLLTWLFIQTRGSLAIVILCHFSANYFGIFNEGIPAVENAWLQAIVTLILAAGLGLFYGPALQRSPAQNATAIDAA
jgi:membrane protease YdiL (CAAX protease family)